MSLTDFDDLYMICCDWCKDGGNEEVIKWKVERYTHDGVTEARITSSNRWWEIAVKEIDKERVNVPL